MNNFCQLSGRLCDQVGRSDRPDAAVVITFDRKVVHDDRIVINFFSLKVCAFLAYPGCLTGETAARLPDWLRSMAGQWAARGVQETFKLKKGGPDIKKPVLS